MLTSEKTMIINFLRTEWRNHSQNVEYYAGVEGKEKTVAWNQARLNDIMVIHSIVNAIKTKDDPQSTGDCPF